VVSKPKKCLGHLWIEEANTSTSICFNVSKTWKNEHGSYFHFSTKTKMGNESCTHTSSLGKKMYIEFETTPVQKFKN
jgi:hypothetical protein